MIDQNNLPRQGHLGLEHLSSASQIIVDPLVRAPLVKVFGAFAMSDLKPTDAARHRTRIVIADIAAWIFTLFVVDPLNAEMRQHLDRPNVPVEIVQQSRRCLAIEVPRLIDKAGNEPGWATATAIGISTGWMSPQRLFDGADPACNALRGLIGTENTREAEG
ncbi:hypothetical protein NOI24_24160 [Neorhizobium galegae]|uniref:hypothetical protein n=1 Tax=Neorhizobium galegae TaxID=399 RepID=UPI002101FC53|nr:hypothetical protein [Neorhizobium galegae]MCQ1774414.1 hypothetical protein [Neorhizobium galegae]